jgi:hypothetical protein
MFYKVLDSIKAIALLLIVWIVYNTSVTLKETSNETLALAKETRDQTISLVRETKDQTISRIDSLRTDTFKFLDKTTVRLDKRIASIQDGTFNRIDKAQSEVLVRVDGIGSDLNHQLEVTNKTVADLANQYAEIPSDVKRVASRFDEQTDCENNELCWQNMTSDLLIDTRNVMRDGSSTFRIVNSAIPKFVNDSTEVSASVAKNMPIIADNIAKTSEHIQKITKPKWYDKILSYGISGGLLYFTAKKP